MLAQEGDGYPSNSAAFSFIIILHASVGSFLLFSHCKSVLHAK